MELQITRDGTVDFRGRPAIKSKTGGWSTSPSILGTQAFATIGYAGVSTNLVLYLTKVLREGNALAANNVSNWIGTSYVTSFIGGFLADAYWGRYWTTAIFLVINLLGMLLLTFTATIPALKPPSCVNDQPCGHATPAQAGLLYVGLYVVALGYGGFQPCLTSFGADQFDKEDGKEQSHATTFFSWFYLSISLGSTISGLLLVYVEDKLSWGLGFGISTAASAIAVIMFFVGTTVYRHHRTAGNPLTRVAQVLVAALHKFQVQVPSDSFLLHEVEEKGSAIQGSRKIQHTKNFRFLDKAAVEIDADEIKANPWRLCTVTQVEEVKCMIRMLPIWATSIVFSSIYTQVSTLFVEQGASMNTHIGRFQVPPASLFTICTLSVILFAPAYQYIVVPLARSLTNNPKGLTTLQRMGSGLVVSILAIACAAVVETFRLRAAKQQGFISTATISTTPTVSMSVFWQIPQYFLVGASEVFTYIGQLDFFYEQSPDAIRGLGVSLSLTSYALGNYVSSLVVTMVMGATHRGSKPGWIPNDLNQGHLDYYFWLFAGISVVNFLLYLVCAKWYTYIKFNKDSEDEEVS